MGMTAKPRVNVSMKQEAKDRLERIAELEHTTMAGVLNRWIWDYKLPEDGKIPAGQQKFKL